MEQRQTTYNLWLCVVDSACSLSINPGTQIHVHKGGGLWVYRDGQLSVDAGAIQGSNNMINPVVFQGQIRAQLRMGARTMGRRPGRYIPHAFESRAPHPEHHY